MELAAVILTIVVIVIVCGVLPLYWGIELLKDKGSYGGSRILGGILALGGTVVLVVMGGVTWLIHLISTTGFTKGRVLRLQGRARMARRALGGGWADDAVPSTSGLTAWQRTVLGEAWLYSAGMEHASVPAFAKLSLKLSALGAPSRLLEDCHTAALDEVRHARRCFALARAYSGLNWTAGTLPELARSAEQPLPTGAENDWARLVRGSLLDGCLSEGLASRVAAEGASRATDPVVRETLMVIAEDEGRHAELGWDVIDFALERGGRSAKEALRQALSELDSRKTPALPPIPGVDEAFLARNGLLPQAELGRLMTLSVEHTRLRAEALLTPSSLVEQWPPRTFAC